MKAKGEFDVELRPLKSEVEGIEGLTLNRLSIEKVFRGDLQGTSTGEMLSAMTAVDGSAGYVAIEQVRGTLEGLPGTFVLQHFGATRDGDNRLILEVVPDSGTGSLRTLRGKMTIDTSWGKHRYEFDYDL